MKAVRQARGGERARRSPPSLRPSASPCRARSVAAAAERAGSSGSDMLHSSSSALLHAFCAGDGADGEQQRGRAFRPRGVRHLERRCRRRIRGDDPRVDDRAGERALRPTRASGAREVEARRPRLARRRPDHAAVDVAAARAPPASAQSPARRRSRRRRHRRTPATERATSTAACGGHSERIDVAPAARAPRRCRRPRAPPACARAAVAALRPSDAQRTVRPPIRSSRPDSCAHLARVKQPDRHRR